MLQAGRLLTTPFARRVSRAGGVRVSPSRPARFSRLSRPSVSSYTIPQFSSARSFYQYVTIINLSLLK